MTERYLTPPQLAKRWRCTPETVLAHIKAGRLRAFTLSPPGSVRPRWRISPDAIIEYEERHRPQVAGQQLRRRTKDPAVTEYF